MDWPGVFVKKTLVLGIGNVLLSDDGAGVHVARILAMRLAGRRDVAVLDGGTLSLTLAPLLAGVGRLIILDATQLDEAPGEIRSFVGPDVDRLLGRARLTVHEIGLRDVLEIARLTGDLPCERALIGIQPAVLTWGLKPTPLVAVALERAAAMALDLLERWPTSAGGPTAGVRAA